MGAESIPYFKSKLTFGGILTPKVWPGCRNDMCLGHTHNAGITIFLEETRWSSSWLACPPLTQDLQCWTRNAHSSSWAIQIGVRQTQASPTLVPGGNFPYARTTKHYKHSPPSSPNTEGLLPLVSFKLSFWIIYFSILASWDFHPMTASPPSPQDFAKSLPAASFSSRALAREPRHQI